MSVTTRHYAVVGSPTKWKDPKCRVRASLFCMVTYSPTA
nr:MAG TPA: hypothetical protein [Bacteriophage sp.]